LKNIDSIQEFSEQDIAHWAYFCCYHRGEYLNRLMDTPLAKIR